MLAPPFMAEAPPGAPPIGIAPPPFGAPVVSPERRALAAGLIELSKQALDLMGKAAQIGDQQAVSMCNAIAGLITKAAGQLQRPPMQPLGDGEEPEPELDRTPEGPPMERMPLGPPPPMGPAAPGPMPGNPLMALLARARMAG